MKILSDDEFDNILRLIAAAHTHLRTFSDHVPKEEQQWTSLDNDVLDCLDKELTKWGR